MTKGIVKITTILLQCIVVCKVLFHRSSLWGTMSLYSVEWNGLLPQEVIGSNFSEVSSTIGFVLH